MHRDPDPTLVVALVASAQLPAAGLHVLPSRLAQLGQDAAPVQLARHRR